ncbi:MAG: A24 family peptidase C-terminal domain-containing protein [Candidatus Hydrothermarchaeaceae archaeon]
MLNVLFVLLAIAGALVASATDLKSRIVPNKLSFGLLAIGVVGNTTYGLYTGDTSLLGDLAKGVLFIFAIGYVFWILGGWSAGDAKEFLFLASLLPRYPRSLYGYLTPNLASYPFPVTILLNTFVLIFPALILYSIVISYKNLSLTEFLKPLLGFKRYIKEGIFIVSALSLGMMLGKPYLIVVALLAFHVPWLKDTHRYLLALVIVTAFIAGNDPQDRLVDLIRYLATTTVFFAIIGVLWNSIGILRNKALRETREISDLQEGDVIAEEIYIQDGKIKRDNRSISEKFMALVLSGAERESRKNRILIASPRAAGLSTKDVSTLKKFVIEGKMDGNIAVKKSMPFAPVTLAGLLSALIVGDIVVLLR